MCCPRQQYHRVDDFHDAGYFTFLQYNIKNFTEWKTECSKHKLYETKLPFVLISHVMSHYFR